MWIKASAFGDINKFDEWLNTKYSQSSIPTIKMYIKRYQHILFEDRIKEINEIPLTIRNNVLKSLIILAKFTGNYKIFKEKLHDNDIKMIKPDAFSSFMRIYNNNASDIIQWYKQAMSVLRDNEALFLKFVLYSGMRKNEALESFDKIIELSRRNAIYEYLNKETEILEHFRFKKSFLRTTKNVFISIIPLSLINEVSKSNTVTYGRIRKALHKYGLRCRINELRDYYSTHMLKCRMLEHEVNLIQGRLPVSVLLRSYWSPSMRELKDRILKNLELLEKEIQANGSK